MIRQVGVRRAAGGCQAPRGIVPDLVGLRLQLSFDISFVVAPYSSSVMFPLTYFVAQMCSCSRCLPLLGNRPLAAMDAKQVAPDNKNRAIAEEGSLLNLKSPENALVMASRNKVRHEEPDGSCTIPVPVRSTGTVDRNRVAGCCYFRRQKTITPIVPSIKSPRLLGSGTGMPMMLPEESPPNREPPATPMDVNWAAIPVAAPGAKS